jgi:hypothetical protein
MQARLSSGDKKLLWVTVLLTVVFAAGAAVVAPPRDPEDSPIPSSYSSTRSGALAAYLLLEDRGFPVQRWQRSPEELPTGTNSVLVLALPAREVTAKHRAALLNYISQGGRVLFIGSGLQRFFPLPATKAANLSISIPYQPIAPSYLTRGAQAIQMQASYEWTGERPKGTPQAETSTLALYGLPKRPVVTVTSLGDGEILWWAGTQPLTNGGLVELQNTSLFLNAMSNSDGSPRSVLWDEYFHGDDSSLWSYIAKTPVPSGLWQLALAAAIVLFSFSRRSGPSVAPAVTSRLSPLEFVDTMGQLYQRADATAVAVEVPYLRLRRQLARRVGRESSLTDAELAAISAQRLGVTEKELRETLEAARAVANAPKAAGKDALTLSQTLAQYSHQFGSVRPIRNTSQEKTT